MHLRSRSRRDTGVAGAAALRRPPRRRSRADELHAARPLLAGRARARRSSSRRRMGFEEPEVVHYEELTEGYTYFVMYGALHARRSTSRRCRARASTSST